MEGLRELAEGNGGSLEEICQQLQTLGMGTAELRKQMAQQLKWQHSAPATP